MTYLTTSPSTRKFVLHSFPIFLFCDLGPNKLFRSCPLLIYFSNLDPFEMNLSDNLMRFVNKRNIESFNLNSTTSLFQVVPTFLRKHLILSWGIYKFISIIFTTSRIVKYIVDVVYDVKLSYRTWMYSLSLKFLMIKFRYLFGVTSLIFFASSAIWNQAAPESLKCKKFLRLLKFR